MRRLLADVVFESHGLSADLAGKTVRAGMATMTSQGAQFALNTVGTIVLARLLTPSDYGVIGMVMVVVGFAQLFKDAGLSMATVQRDTITREQISTLFWINLLISGILGVFVLLSAPLVAWFYGRPELTPVTAALSISFLITGTTIQHHALLRRHMHFDSLAIIQITSQVVSISATIALALCGWRYWALVGGTLVLGATSALLTPYFCPWLPGKMQRGTGVRDMLRFGGHLTAFSFVNYFARNTDNILIGKFIGADALGLYVKAYQLFMLPIVQIRGPIDHVAIPSLCAIRDHHERYRQYYRLMIFTIAFLTMPPAGYAIVFADGVILAVLGEQWYGAAAMFQVLAVTALLQSAVQAGRALPLMSMGRSSRYLRLGIVQAIATCLGMIAGLPWGAVGVAAGYGVGFHVLIPFTLGWCLKGSPATTRDWLRAAYTPVLATLAMTAFLAWVRGPLLQGADVRDLSLYENLKVLGVAALGGAAVYGLTLMLLRTGRENVLSIARQLKLNILSRKAAAAS